MYSPSHCPMVFPMNLQLTWQFPGHISLLRILYCAHRIQVGLVLNTVIWVIVTQSQDYDGKILVIIHHHQYYIEGGEYFVI